MKSHPPSSTAISSLLSTAPKKSSPSPPPSSSRSSSPSPLSSLSPSSSHSSSDPSSLPSQSDFLLSSLKSFLSETDHLQHDVLALFNDITNNNNTDKNVSPSPSPSSSSSSSISPSPSPTPSSSSSPSSASLSPSSTRSLSSLHSSLSNFISFHSEFSHSINPLLSPINLSLANVIDNLYSHEDKLMEVVNILDEQFLPINDSPSSPSSSSSLSLSPSSPPPTVNELYTSLLSQRNHHYRITNITSTITLIQKILSIEKKITAMKNEVSKGKQREESEEERRREKIRWEVETEIGEEREERKRKREEKKRRKQWEKEEKSRRIFSNDNENNESNENEDDEDDDDVDIDDDVTILQQKISNRHSQRLSLYLSTYSEHKYYIKSQDISRRITCIYNDIISLPAAQLMSSPPSSFSVYYEYLLSLLLSLGKEMMEEVKERCENGIKIIMNGEHNNVINMYFHSEIYENIEIYKSLYILHQKIHHINQNPAAKDENISDPPVPSTLYDDIIRYWTPLFGSQFFLPLLLLSSPPSLSPPIAYEFHLYPSHPDKCSPISLSSSSSPSLKWTPSSLSSSYSSSSPPFSLLKFLLLLHSSSLISSHFHSHSILSPLHSSLLAHIDLSVTSSVDSSNILYMFIPFHPLQTKKMRAMLKETIAYVDGIYSKLLMSSSSSSPSHTFLQYLKDFLSSYSFHYSVSFHLHCIIQTQKNIYNNRYEIYDEYMKNTNSATSTSTSSTTSDSGWDFDMDDIVVPDDKEIKMKKDFIRFYNEQSIFSSINQTSLADNTLYSLHSPSDVKVIQSVKDKCIDRVIHFLTLTHSKQGFPMSENAISFLLITTEMMEIYREMKREWKDHKGSKSGNIEDIDDIDVDIDGNGDGKKDKMEDKNDIPNEISISPLLYLRCLQMISRLYTFLPPHHFSSQFPTIPHMAIVFHNDLKGISLYFHQLEEEIMKISKEERENWKGGEEENAFSVLKMMILREKKEEEENGHHVNVNGNSMTSIVKSLMGEKYWKMFTDHLALNPSEKKDNESNIPNNENHNSSEDHWSRDDRINNETMEFLFDDSFLRPNPTSLSSPSLPSPSSPYILSPLFPAYESLSADYFSLQVTSLRSRILTLLHQIDTFSSFAYPQTALEIFTLNKQILHSIAQQWKIWSPLLPKQIISLHFSRLLSKCFNYFSELILTCEDLSTTMTHQIHKLLDTWNIKYHEEDNETNQNENSTKLSAIRQYSKLLFPLYSFDDKVIFSCRRLAELRHIMEEQQTLVSLVHKWKKKEFQFVNHKEIIILILLTFEESENRGKAIRIIEANPGNPRKREAEGEEEEKGESKVKESEKKENGESNPSGQSIVSDNKSQKVKGNNE